MIKAGGLEKERKEVLPIIAALAVAIAPHVPGLPLWINIWCFTLWGYMLVRLRAGWPLPPAPVRHALTFLGIAGLLATYRTGIGADAFVGLMALMAAIKPFEMPTHRHQMITILLTYFMIITSLFRSDALFTVVYMLFSVFITTTAMVRINSPAASFGQSRKLAGTILAQALPLVVILFMVFPRLPESLVGFQDPSRGKTGFTETMEPGKISSMARDQTPAFRVSFESGRPPAAHLYWRGIVFQDFDGKTWRPHKKPDFSSSRTKKKPDTKDSDIRQTILLAPHNSHWLMALDRPIQGPPWAAPGRDHTLKSRKKIGKKTQYKAVSRLPEFWMTAALDRHAPEALRNRILSGTGNQNPKTLELARKIAGNGTPREKANRLLAYFKNNEFIYTLNAPLPGPHPLDTFIFKTRKGYCEHYASAFAFMLNGAGVPARVVGGYLGGELNPFGGYLIVRQSYAHAWVELFDPENGWTRLDPTGVVSPERMFTNPDGSSSGSASSTVSLSLVARMNFALDAVNLKWESWFTRYSHLEQRAWLAALGLVRGNRAAAPVLMVLTLLGAGLFSAVLIRQFRRGNARHDPVAQAMDKFYKKLEKPGLTPTPGQGPKAFGDFCMKKRPDLSNEIRSILDLYLGLRYKKDCPGTALKELKARIKKFTPGKIRNKEYK